MKVYNNNVIIQPESKESTFDKRKIHYKGKVLHVGDKLTENINIGDMVYFSAFNSTFIEEENWYVVSEANVLAKYRRAR